MRTNHALSQKALDAIGSMLRDAMDAAVKNGANSVSMPDEYVEIAYWLQDLLTGVPSVGAPDTQSGDLF